MTDYPNNISTKLEIIKASYAQNGTVRRKGLRKGRTEGGQNRAADRAYSSKNSADHG